MLDLSFLVDDADGILDILKGSRTIAVVGLSPSVGRPSHGVARYLLDMGYHVLPVNPNVKEVFGLPAVASLRDLREQVDVVDVFRRSAEVGPIADDAIAIGAKVLWLQDGVIDTAAARRAHDAGLRVVMDRCMLRDHRRFLGA